MSSEIVSGKSFCMRVWGQKPGQLGGALLLTRSKRSKMFTRQIKNRRINIIIAALCFGIFTVCGLSACQIQTKTEVDQTLTPKLASSATIHEGVLTVGINASNSPYGGTNTDKQTVGLDVDVAAALAQELGLQLQIVDVSSSGRNALTNKQVDVALGLMKSGTSDKVSYSDSYISDGPSLYCLSKNKPTTVESVASETAAGKAKILVQADTTAAMKTQESVGIDKVVAKPTLQATFDALESGEQRYLVADAAIGDYFARNYDDVVRVGFLGADCVTPNYAVTLSQNTALSSGVNTAMKTLNNNGVMRVIVAKWLGTDGQTLLPSKIELSKLPAKAFGL
jgi:polar amino acid transport system substrate-binding protein